MHYFNFALLSWKLCMKFSYPRYTVLNLQIQLKMHAETCVGPHVKCQCCPLLTVLLMCQRILVRISGIKNVTKICYMCLKLFPAYAVDRWILIAILHDANTTVGDGRPPPPSFFYIYLFIIC
jgi:hypothetical protein